MIRSDFAEVLLVDSRVDAPFKRDGFARLHDITLQQSQHVTFAVDSFTWARVRQGDKGTRPRVPGGQHIVTLETARPICCEQKLVTVSTEIPVLSSPWMVSNA